MHIHFVGALPTSRFPSCRGFEKCSTSRQKRTQSNMTTPCSFWKNTGECSNSDVDGPLNDNDPATSDRQKLSCFRRSINRLFPHSLISRPSRLLHRRHPFLQRQQRRSLHALARTTRGNRHRKRRRGLIIRQLRHDHSVVIAKTQPPADQSAA